MSMVADALFPQMNYSLKNFFNILWCFDQIKLCAFNLIYRNLLGFFKLQIPQWENQRNQKNLQKNLKNKTHQRMHIMLRDELTLK
jgi:hypothetical protein